MSRSAGGIRVSWRSTLPCSDELTENGPIPEPGPSLTGAYARLARAGEHIAELTRLNDVLVAESKPLLRVYQKGGAQTVRWKGAPSRQEETVFGVRTGEVVYNLRAALDYLVYELAFLDSGEEQRWTQFPICDKESAFALARQRGQLAGLSEEHIGAIEEYQPYRDCDWARRVRDLSNPDKHRRPIFAEGKTRIGVLSSVPVALMSQIPPASVEPMDESPTPDIPLFVERIEQPVFGFVAVYMVFDDGEPVVETLTSIQAHVSAVLDAFAPDFPTP